MGDAQIVILGTRRRGLECSTCGARAQAGCDCAAPYVPAGQRAAVAVRANPDKSDRAIAAEIGVTHPTVAKARRTTGKDLPVGKRTGRDNKARKMPAKATARAADEVDTFTREISAFLTQIQPRFRKFVAANPDLTDDARFALAYSFRTFAEEMMDMAGLV